MRANSARPAIIAVEPGPARCHSQRNVLVNLFRSNGGYPDRRKTHTPAFSG